MFGTPVVSMVGPKTPKEAKDSEMNQNIQVFVRCRPLKQNERKSVVDVLNDRREVRINERGGVQLSTKTFTFDNVFSGETNQIEVYLSVVEPLIEQVIMGYNCTVFAYGQTGTGKTYTMEGERSNDECSWESDPECGIIPRALHQLFTRLESQKNEHTVRVSFLEMYNEEIYDLLSANDDTTKLKIYEDNARKGSTIVGGLEEITVNTKAEIYDILRKGSSKRQTACTLLNACSSRSHTIFSVTVHIKESSIEGEDMVKIGKLNLVDLAGSENIGRSGAIDKQRREAGNINQSLLTLGRVITCLVEKAPHVPYRESKLTRLLQDSLGGRTKTSIIATISPHILDVEDTISTLEYAQRAKKIMNKPEVNQKMSKKTLLREYTAEIERLRRDLAACREKNGIYINQENYNELLEKIKVQCEEIEIKMAHIQALNEEISKVQSLFEITKEELDVKSVELEKTSDTLKQTSNELLDTKNILCVTKVERDEQKHLVDKHVDTEKVLLSQAQQLVSVADNTTTDAEKLHAKIDRQKNIDTSNQSKIDEFQKKIAVDMKRLEDLVCVTTSTQHDDTKDLENIVMNNYNQLNDEVSNFRNVVNYLSDFTKDRMVLDQSIELKDYNKELFNEMISFYDSIFNKVVNSQLSLEKGLKSIEDMMFEQTIATKKLFVEYQTNLSNITQIAKDSFAQTKTDIAMMSDNYSKELSAYKDENEQRLQNEQTRSQRIIISLANIIDDENKAAVERNKFCTESVEKFNSAQISAQISANKFIGNIDKLANNILAEEKIANECNEKANNLNDENSKQIINRCNEIESDSKEKFEETTSALDSNKIAIMAQSDKCVKLSDVIVESIGKQINEKQRALADMSEKLDNISEIVGSAREKVSEKIEEMNRNVSTMQKSQIREIVNRSKDIERFLKSWIVCTPTGDTPQKTNYNYPKNLAQTSPHDRILQRYRALMEPLDAINAPLPEEADDSEFYSDSSSISSRVASSSSLASVNNENIPSNNSKEIISKVKSKERIFTKFDKKSSSQVKNDNKKPSMMPLKAKNIN